MDLEGVLDLHPRSHRPGGLAAGRPLDSLVGGLVIRLAADDHQALLRSCREREKFQLFRHLGGEAGLGLGDKFGRENRLVGEFEMVGVGEAEFAVVGKAEKQEALFEALFFDVELALLGVAQLFARKQAFLYQNFRQLIVAQHRFQFPVDPVSLLLGAL